MFRRKGNLISDTRRKLKRHLQCIVHLFIFYFILFIPPYDKDVDDDISFGIRLVSSKYIYVTQVCMGIGLLLLLLYCTYLMAPHCWELRRGIGPSP